MSDDLIHRDDLDMDRQQAESLACGICIDCKAQMPGYPSSFQTMPDDWQPASGWGYFTDAGSDVPVVWQCPECSAKDEAECESDDDQ